MDTIDKKMFEELSKIYEKFNESSSNLWNNNYKFNEKPLILIRTNREKGIVRKYSYVINVEEFKNSIFSKKVNIPDYLKLPTVYRVNNLNLNMISTWIPSNFGTVNINTNKVFYFKYNPQMMENPELYFDFSSFLLHESFHTYNQKNWIYDENDGEYVENYPVNIENYALMGVEFKLLDKCMESNNKSEISKYLRQWTLIRNYRYKKWPQLLAETNTEAIEGTARYIEYKYSKLSGGKLTVLANKEAPYHVTFIHAYNCIADNIAESPAYLERPIKYETGAAVCLIMDKLNIEWKKYIEDSREKRGKTQYEILKYYYDISYKNYDEISNVKSENDYEELLKKGEKIVNLYNK
ncbi:hypothetical protein [Clostridium ihumii]|uniref:hypothetical protein n=1 Tax=Clostridium ihumii TaxID=1470356 RepID=UPI000A8B2CEA|nr:hypothetical protein [Clostridium ihumii]